MAAAAVAARDALKRKAEREAASTPVRSRQVFDKYDKDGGGSLDVDEVKAAIKELLEYLKANAHLISGLPPGVVQYDSSCLGAGKKLPFQDEVQAFYFNPVVVMLVAGCIIGNFLINIVEKEIDPNPLHPEYNEDLWNGFDTVFNIIFDVELILNMWGYGGPVREFWKSGWNCFDSLIVLVGNLTMIGALGPPLDKLKLMRAFRVFRLFKRVKELNKIVVALVNSIKPVMYAFIVMLVFFCIYAILAVEFFRDFGEGGYYETWDEHGNVTYNDATTPRGYVHGLEYYGTFMRALYTLFQVMTGESWSEAVARPLLFGLYRGSSFTVGFFFCSFVLLMQLVLINVVVAVLLDNFSPAEDAKGTLENIEDESTTAPSQTGPGTAASVSAVAVDMPADLGAPQNIPPPAKAGDVEGKLDLILVQLGKLDALDAKVAALSADVAKLKSSRLSGPTA